MRAAPSTYTFCSCPQYTRLSESDAAREHDDRGNRRFSPNQEDLGE
jgi:hypothetical protein